MHLLVLWQLHLKCTSPQLVALLKELKEFVCPGANRANVKPYKSLLLRGGAYREGMPLILGNGGDLDEDVVSWLEGEVGGPCDD